MLANLQIIQKMKFYYMFIKKKKLIYKDKLKTYLRELIILLKIDILLFYYDER